MFDLGSRSSSPCNLHPWLKSQYGGCTSSTKCRGTVSQTCRAGSAAGVPARWFYPGCCTGWAAGLDSTKEDYTTVSYTSIHYVTGQFSPTYCLELVGLRFCERTKFSRTIVSLRKKRTIHELLRSFQEIKNYLFLNEQKMND